MKQAITMPTVGLVFVKANGELAKLSSAKGVSMSLICGAESLKADSTTGLDVLNKVLEAVKKACINGFVRPAGQLSATAAPQAPHVPQADVDVSEETPSPEEAAKKKQQPKNRKK